MVWQDTQQRFEGEWDNDVPDGQGVYVWLNIAGLGAGLVASASTSAQDELSLTHLQDCNRYVGTVFFGVSDQVDRVRGSELKSVRFC